MKRNSDQRRWSANTKLFVSGLLVALLVFLLTRFGVVLAPLVLASMLAYVLSPVVGRIEDVLNIKRGLATLIVYILLIGLLALIPVLIIPPLVDQLDHLNLDIQDIIRSVDTFLGSELVIGDFTIDVSQMAEQLLIALQGILEPLFGQTLGIAFEVISSAVWGVFIFVIAFYLIKDGSRLWIWLEGAVLPEYQDDFRRLRNEINAIWNAFFRGQLILALAVAFIFIAAGFILGIPFALAMGVLAGLLEFIPSIGHGIWLVIASLLTLFQGSTWIPLPNWIVMIIVIGLHMIFQQVDLNVLIPRIIGRRVHLHPLVVILGIIVGAVFAGVLGVVLAAPTIASARALGRYIYAKLLDLEPFQENQSNGIDDMIPSAAQLDRNL
jgi:predicted PurR-regulated permease PerM